MPCCTCGGHTSNVCSYTSTCLKQFLIHHCTCQTSWPLRLQEFSSLHLSIGVLVLQEIQTQVLTFVKQMLYPLIHLLSPQNMKNTHSRFTMCLDVIEAQEYFGCVHRFSCMANIVNLLHQATSGSNEQNQCFLVGTSSSLCGVRTEHKAEH